MSQIPLLSLATWIPAVGALLLLLVRDRAAQRIVALAASGLVFVLLIAVFASFAPANPEPQLVERLNWVPAWGISYSMAVDGVNLWLAVLTAFMMPLALAVANPERRSGAYYGLLLLLETGILGTFLAQDLILFYVFFEFTLVPTALLLGGWGGADRIHAAAKFFLYTFAGSVFMLLAIIALYLTHGQQTGSYTFEYQAILRSLRSDALILDPAAERLLFGGFLIAFAVKIALWPLHTWMPLLHSQTPADGAVDVGAVLLKVIGGYGIARFAIGLFPAATLWAAPAVGILAVIGIVYGAWVAYNQPDAKQLLAYSSVSHLGFVVLGMFALNTQGLAGGLLQLVNYGITTGALFIAVGVIEQRFGTRRPRDLGGLWLAMPAFGAVMLAFVLASIGLPGLNGFVGEFTIIQAAWLSSILGWRYVFVAVLGVILAAVYLLSMYRHMFMGALRPEHAGAEDVSDRQLAPMAILLIPMLVIGLYPNLVLSPMQPAVEQIVQGLGLAISGR